jgi:hypothetical protein
MLAGALMVWAGANLWTAIFGWSELVSGDPSNRSLSLLLTILVTALPGAVGTWLLWTVLVGPDDPRYNRSIPDQPSSASGSKGKKKQK